MEQRKLKILLSKNGNGSLNPRCPISIEWFKKLGFTEEEFEANAYLEEKENGKFRLIIEKDD